MGIAPDTIQQSKQGSRDGNIVVVTDDTPMSLWIVIIEWEGKKVPMRFYRYVKRILGNDDGNSVSKRAGRAQERTEHALWAQESVYILADRDRAGLIVALARELEAERAWLIEAPGFETLDVGDRLAAKYLMSAWSRRGPKPDREEGWQEQDVQSALHVAREQVPVLQASSEGVHTYRSICLECTYRWQSKGISEPLRCPLCQTTKIASREIAEEESES